MKPSGLPGKIRRRLPRDPWLSLLGLSVFSAALRAFRLGQRSLWKDEMNQVLVARRSWSELIEGVQGHLAPPLDYAISKLTMHLLGSSDLAVRLPAFFFGTATVPLFYLLARRLCGQRASLIAAVLLALSPLAIEHAQEVRMYALLLFLSVAAAHAALSLGRGPGIRQAVVWSLLSAALLWTHYYGLLVLVLLGGAMLGHAVWGRRSGRTAALVLVAALASLLLFTPWLRPMQEQLQRVESQAWYTLAPDLYFFKGLHAAFTSNGAQRDLWMYLSAMLFALGALRAWRTRERPVLLSALAFAISLGALFLLSYRFRSVTPRNLISLLPLYLLVCGHGAAWLLSRLRPEAAAVITALVFAWPAYAQHSGLRPAHKPNWKVAAAFLEQRASPDEPIIVPSKNSREALAYYLIPQAPARGESLKRGARSIWIDREGTEASSCARLARAWLVIPPATLTAQARAEFLTRHGALGQPPMLELATQREPLLVVLSNSAAPLNDASVPRPYTVSVPDVGGPAAP